MTTHPNDPLDTLLQELGPADPPAGFAESVMSKVATTEIKAGDIPTPARIIPFSSGGITMSITRKAMWGLAAAATVILAVFVARGFPPVGRGTEGAIGAAKKYQAPQIGANDVVTGDAAAQEFLQSETFDRLIKDKDAVAALSDADFRNLLRDHIFAANIKDAGVRDAMQSGVINRVFADLSGRAALEDALKNYSRAAVHDAAAKASAKGADLDAAMRTLARHELSPQIRMDLKNMLSNDAVRTALSNDQFRDQLSRSNVRGVMTRPAVSAALSNRYLADALTQRGFASALGTRQFEAALAPR